MTLATIRRLAADIMGVGRKKVKIDPARVGEADKALTRSDVRNLIANKVITKAPVKGRRKKVPQRRRGHGSKKGSQGARSAQKDLWMAKVRSQRKLLNQLLDEGVLPKEPKRKIYNRVKSGLFKSKRALITYLKEAQLIPVDYEYKKKAAPKPKKEAPKKKAAKDTMKTKKEEAEKS